MAEVGSGNAPAPHDFRDQKAHMVWQMERSSYVNNVPLIPSDMSLGSGSATTSATALQKAFGNPFVPIGMAATVGCLVGMLAATLKRNSNRAQQFMRGRVVAQGLTVAALVGGALFFGIGAAGEQPPAPSSRGTLPAGPPRSQPNSA